MTRRLWLIWVCTLACSFDSGSAGTGDPGVGSSTGGTSEVTGETVDPTTQGTGGTQGTTNPSTGGITSATSTEGETTAGPAEGSSSSDTTDGPGETTEQGSSSSGGLSFELCDAADPDLRACYDFADPGSGVLTDLSMYGNDGTITAVGVATGPFGDAVSMSEAAEVAVPDADTLDIQGPLTYEAWVYFESLPFSGRAGVLDNEGQYSIVYYPDMGIRCNASNSSAFAPGVPVGEWMHVACVYTDTSMTVWINGEMGEIVGATGNAPTTDDNPMSIGDTSPGFNEPMDGRVGGVRVWSSERSPAEIMEAAAALD